MKPTSTLSLLFLLRLASSAPIPLSIDAIYPTDCHSKSCIISLLTAPHSTHQPPPSHFAEPHLPNHELEDNISEKPITTSSSKDASTQSLSSDQPLSSSYLLSLANPASKPAMQKDPFQKHPESTAESLPAKPSSALPELRAADLRKYWESLRPSTVSASPKNSQIESCDMGIGAEMVGSERFYYMRRTRMGTRRDYADLMVVGIVVLFLAVVVALEAVERCGDLGGILFERRRRGEIYLEEDDVFIVRRPFELSPAPASRHKNLAEGYGDEKEALATYDRDTK